MKCCEQYAAALSAFVDGELSENEKEEVLSHVEHCQNCREYLSELMIVHTMFEEMPELDAPEGFSNIDLLLDGRLCELKSPTSDASGVNGLRFIERNIRKAVRQFEKAEGGPVRPSIVVLNCEEVPVTREDALKRVRLEMSRHDIDHVILLTRGGAIDDIKK